jgi:hypothetical protein
MDSPKLKVADDSKRSAEGVVLDALSPGALAEIKNARGDILRPTPSADEQDPLVCLYVFYVKPPSQGALTNYLARTFVELVARDKSPRASYRSSLLLFVYVHHHRHCPNFFVAPSAVQHLQ